MLTVKTATVPEICLVAPSVALAELVREVSKARNISIGIYTGVLDEGVKVARELAKSGAKIFISRKGTAALLSEQGFNVAKINTTLNDYLRHLNLMKRHNGKIAIVEYNAFLPELHKLCAYLGVQDAEIFGYSNATDYECSVQRALNSHASILLGGGETLPKEAKRLNIPHTVVENTEQSINLAIDTAVQLLKIQKDEAEKIRHYKIQYEQYSAVVNYSNDAILSIDTHGCIIISNEKARQLLKFSSRGRANIQQVLPMLDFSQLKVATHVTLNRIIKLNELMLSVNEMPIVVNEHFEGAIILIKDIRDIQNSEKEIRLHLYNKGHTAKYNFDAIIGDSERICRTKQIASNYASTASSILIVGETGTGKELFAQSIHNNSMRRNGPFVAINCAALPKELLSSELFGYEEGAFSGAVKGGKAGIFEVAHGGTIFLDEIGEIPQETQIQLLRVLQEKEVRRLSSDKVIPIDVRVICATNRDLSTDVFNHRFRMDLFYRINVLKLSIPPLRERREDIPLIVSHAIAGFSNETQARVQAYMSALYPRLSEYPWPGNIRELLGVIERVTTLLNNDAPMTPDLELLIDMPSLTSQSVTDTSEQRQPVAAPLSREVICSTLAENQYSKQKTAKALGISRSTLWRLMRQFGLYDS
jgi:transcriptional regulator with PAS, ATPase and Fis domain